MAGFRNVVKKIVQGGGGSTGEVDRERLQYDNRNINRRAVEQNPRVSIVSQEMNQKAEDTVTAAVLGQANEINERAVETSISTVTGTANEPNRKAAPEMPMIAGSVAEMNRKASDATTATVIPTADVAKRAVEVISNTVTATAGEVGRRQADLIETVIIPLTDVNRKAAIDTVPVTADVRALADAVVSNSGFTNPQDAVTYAPLNTDGSWANLQATSSGLAGLTSNTASGTIVISFPNTFPRDFPIAGKTILLRHGSGVVGGGTLPIGRRANLSLDVSYNDGANWGQVDFFGGVITPQDFLRDITAGVIAATGVSSPSDSQIYDVLDRMQFRMTGSVTSGTGIGATIAARLYNAAIVFTTNKTY